ncbi:MAG TPA: ATP-binding protein [Aromatoleum sp.]|uniref:PAS domain-containing hybrid sensor histidine kinase/response regulator n=1 Tax=Aromatoleum sp. TaxID=2307007 RepID=UPI002B491956|nr:ATP-binding protein [Aromatoleum sp.]HJV25595.1 ATP-binding protein [Aromatoleum sp.]
MLNGTIDPALIARCERVACGCAIAVMVIGIAVLLGWWLQIDVLTGAVQGRPPAKPNTGLGFILAGLSLLASMRRKPGSGWGTLHLSLAGALTVLGALTGIEHLTDWNLGFDTLLYDPAQRSHGFIPTPRMAFATSISFILTGLALLGLDSRARMASCAAALGSSVIGVLALMGYVFGVPALFQADPYSAVALPTAVALVAINIGILHARPRRRPIAVLISRTVGGVMARRLLPLAVTAPFLLGWLSIRGEAAGLYDARFGIALLSLIYVVLFTALIWHTAESLRRSDHRRLSAELERRQQQSQLAGIIETAMDAIVMVDSTQRVVLFNPAAEEMFGRSTVDVLGAPLDILLPQRFREAHREHVGAFANDAMGRKGRVGTIVGVRANGEEFPIEASLAHVQVDGEHYLTAILRDDTERREVMEALRASEKRESMRAADLSTLLDAAPAAVWMALDAEAADVRGNKVLYEWLQLPEGINIAPYLPYGGKRSNIRLLKNGVDIPVSQLPLKRAAAGFEVRDYEYQLVSADGTSRHLLGNATPLLDEWGRPRGAISAFVDITARYEAEVAMTTARTEAERANNAKSRFLAAASHDLRQPLSALALYITVLEDKLSAADLPVATNMKACVSSLSELLTDLLDLSKLEAGVITPNACTFSVAELLADQISMHAPEADLKGLRLDCRPARRMARTDPVLFRRILGNLIDNAIRYTDQGGVLVACRRRRGKTWIEVWDTGIGIAEDKTGEIFEEFRQLHDEARTRGSGLGLAIVAKAAALLGLEISVRSRPGRGSVFAIELPLVYEVFQAETDGGDFSYRPLGIGLVEDNLLVREAMASALQNVGHRVLAVATGAELCAELEAFQPDIVVSDYRLAQGETGFDVITAARALLKRNLPSIIITGDTDPRLMRSMAARGIVVLHKPLDMETLQAYLHDMTSEEPIEAG